MRGAFGPELRLDAYGLCYIYLESFNGLLITVFQDQIISCYYRLIDASDFSPQHQFVGAVSVDAQDETLAVLQEIGIDQRLGRQFPWGWCFAMRRTQKSCWATILARGR